MSLIIQCPACGANIEWSLPLGLQWTNRTEPCPQCVNAIAMELEQGMMELVAQGKAAVVGKTKDGCNLYDLVEGG